MAYGLTVPIELCAEGEANALVAQAVMRALPQWFELEEGLVDLVEAARKSPTFIATVDGGDVGFLTLKPQTPYAAEIIAMGVLPNWHRQGIGRALVEEACRSAWNQGMRLCR